MKKFFLLLLSAPLLLASCIQDEALNAEADILACTVEDGILMRPVIIENDKVTIWVFGDTDIKHQSPTFELTPGATIFPANGTERDFTTPQQYTVTSQDGQWSKTYTVLYQFQSVITKYHLDDYYLKDTPPYYVFQEKDEQNGFMEWGSGNEGFKLAALFGAPGGKKPENFPTYAEPNGYNGACVALQTRDTGKMGANFGSPIAAGNLFLGTFKLDASDPAASTRFGVPFNYIPLSIKGYYKYTAGTQFYEGKDKIPVNKQDYWDIYGILYEVDENTLYLDGHNILSHENIVSVARLPQNERVEASEWTLFEIPFSIKENKQIDKEGLKQGKYNLAIVLTSSEEGAAFNGAIDSKLLVDELELTYAEE